MKFHVFDHLMARVCTLEARDAGHAIQLAKDRDILAPAVQDTDSFTRIGSREWDDAPQGLTSRPRQPSYGR